jgi:hypothetical protein
MHLITMSKSGSFLGRAVSLSLGFLLFVGLTVSHGAGESLEIKTVISDGLGTDVPSAAQNAAQNALTQVVGSFMDATKVLEKRVEIQEGVRTQSSKIDTNIKEYSQGSIQGFEVLGVSEQSGLTKVTAKVSVRLEDFKNYIKKLAEGEVAVAGESLFAKAATETKQTKNKASLLFENVIAPIVNGEVTIFELSQPRPLNLAKGYPNVNAQAGLSKMVAQYGKENIFAIEITASLNPEFLANMKSSLESIAQKKIYRSSVEGLATNGSAMRDASKVLYGDEMVVFNKASIANDVVLIVNNGKAEIDLKSNHGGGFRDAKISSDIYLFSDIKEKLRLISRWVNFLYDGQGWPVHNLQISLLDSNDAVLQEETILNIDTLDSKQKRAIAIGTDYTEGVLTFTKPAFKDLPWLMLSGNKGNGIPVILAFEKRSFDIILAIKPEALAKTKIIRINLVN